LTEPKGSDNTLVIVQFYATAVLVFLP
jgi:hypothetical protein